jgi:2-polyprenyl-3-methyl-5-hydroxy-6-metoxy-1,4-benzoquinol methylase
MTKNYKCPICDSESELNLKLDKVNVYKCLECKHLFSKDSQLTTEEIYDSKYFNETHKKWFDNPDIKLFKKILKYIDKHHDKKVKIIDIGCGNGNYLLYMKQNGYNNLTGLDIIDIFKYDFNYIKSDIFDYFPNEKFDIVLTFMNIEHIEDVNSYITKFKEIAGKDGLIVINTICEDSLIYSFAKILYRFGIKFAANRLYEVHHINHFSFKSLQKLFERNGLKEVYSIRKNYNLNTVDVGDDLKSKILLLFIGTINFFSTIFNRQIMQVRFLINKSK